MKKFLTFILVLAMVMSVSSVAMAAGDKWDGTVDTTWYNAAATSFTINTAAELAGLASLVNSGTDNFSGDTITLGNDIDLDNKAWTPIGTGTRSGRIFSGQAFKGTFDGGNNTISNLAISDGVASSVIGLFGGVDGGTVKNLTLSDVSINAAINENAGAAIGLMVNGATADNITVSGSVSAADGVGGIVGRMIASGVISNCTNYATVRGKTAGGIVGKAYYTDVGEVMTISGCKNYGAVNCSYAAGGIAGLSAANIKYCTNEASITAGTEAGGIVGEQVNRGIVSNNTNSGTISNKSSGGTAYGGIIGWIRYQTSSSDYPTAANEVIQVSNNTNSGNILADGATLGSGGIVGTIYNQALVTGNTNTATSIKGGVFASGIVGGAQQEDNNVIIDGETINAYNNVSTTETSDIEANCVSPDMYNNASGKFVAEDNSAAWAAKVGDTKYATLKAAVDAAQNGDTITLLTDASASDVNTNGKDLTIVDKNGVEHAFKGGVSVSPATLDFGTKEAGYSGVNPLTVIVKGVEEGNKGKPGMTGEEPVKVTLPDEAKNKYTVEIKASGNREYTISICPVDGLGAGNHNTTFTVYVYGGPVGSPAERELTVDALFTVTAPTSSTPSSSGSGYSGPDVWYIGGNTFGTNTNQVPTSVEIDQVPVSFTMNGSQIVVGCVDPNANWVKVSWGSTTNTVFFNPDASVVCTQVGIPKTGDMSIWAAIAQFLGF